MQVLGDRQHWEINPKGPTDHGGSSLGRLLGRYGHQGFHGILRQAGMCVCIMVSMIQCERLFAQGEVLGPWKQPGGPDC